MFELIFIVKWMNWRRRKSEDRWREIDFCLNRLDCVRCLNMSWIEFHCFLNSQWSTVNEHVEQWLYPMTSMALLFDNIFCHVFSLWWSWEEHLYFNKWSLFLPILILFSISIRMCDIWLTFDDLTMFIERWDEFPF